MSQSSNATRHKRKIFEQPLVGCDTNSAEEWCPLQTHRSSVGNSTLPVLPSFPICAESTLQNTHFHNWSHSPAGFTIHEKTADI
mmetsp:Transcript_5698/g.11616  ORF Transcript_5698/g.11616 Transcript_5698/m.11616 type:complete len:84 (-) Transcript_5698:138-389(-)